MVVMLAACHQTHASTYAPASPRDTTVRAIVRVVGADPMTQVVLRSADTGAGVGVVGARRLELASLSGVEIEATGPTVANQPPIPPRAVDVREYEVVAVGETPARSGILRRHGGAYWLIGRHDSVELATPISEGLAAAAGQRVYVGGVVEGGKLHEQLFGRIGGH